MSDPKIPDSLPGDFDFHAMHHNAGQFVMLLEQLSPDARSVFYTAQVLLVKLIQKYKKPTSSIEDLMDGFVKNTKEMLAGLQADPAMFDGIAPSTMSPGNDSIN